MIFLITTMFLPVCVALFFWVKYDRDVTMGEFLAHVFICFMVSMCSSCASFEWQTRDTEMLNGHVTKKYYERVSCEHDYKCHCTRDRKGRESCRTCYEHFYDIDWIVATNVGKVKIRRVDRQGTSTPARWDAAIVGEPATLPHSYTNYIKGDPSSLFKEQDAGLMKKFSVPNPPKVYDYYRATRLIQVGGNTLSREDAERWDDRLDQINSTLGPRKQCNIVLILAKDTPKEYAKAVDIGWLGGKKNEVTVIVGTNSDLDVQWVEVLAWSMDAELHTYLQSDLLELEKVFMPELTARIRKNVEKYYKRKPMAKFEYLKANIRPTFGQWLVTVILATLISFGVGEGLRSNNVRNYGHTMRSNWGAGKRW